MNRDVQDSWPAKPESWPEILTTVETCQFLRLDRGRCIAAAKRTLRHLRRTKGLASVGRFGGDVHFRLETVEAWLVERERRQAPTTSGVTKAQNGD